MMRYIHAVEWICDHCHDTGVARDLPAASAALGEHTEEYH